MICLFLSQGGSVFCICYSMSFSVKEKKNIAQILLFILILQNTCYEYKYKDFGF